jgi:hypothetical protein
MDNEYYSLIEGTDCLVGINGKTIGEIIQINWKYSPIQNNGTVTLKSYISNDYNPLSENYSGQKIVILCNPYIVSIKPFYFINQLEDKTNSSCRLDLSGPNVTAEITYNISKDFVCHDLSEGQQQLQDKLDKLIKQNAIGIYNFNDSDIKICDNIIGKTSAISMAWTDYLVSKYSRFLK